MRIGRQHLSIRDSGWLQMCGQALKSKIQNPKSKILWRGLTSLGIFLLLSSVAAPAFAHDNLGGDEMSMAITIFIAGVITIVGAVLAGIWAWRNGQFNDVEQVKYTMLENADDLDDLPAGPGLVRPARMQGGSHAAK